MEENNQYTFGFMKNVIIYCSKCKIKYNKTNEKDVKFHQKIHKSKFLPKSIKIGDDLYQTKNSLYLANSSLEILAKCTGKIENDVFYVKEKESISEEFAKKLYLKLQFLFKDIKNYWKLS